MQIGCIGNDPHLIEALRTWASLKMTEEECPCKSLGVAKHKAPRERELTRPHRSMV